MKSLDQLPPFSPVVNSLMASLADEDVSFAHLASVIERDSVLAGNVLRLVNSALYGRRGTISSVRAAVSILGLTKLRNYVLGLSVARIWAKAKTPPSWDMERFNLHGTAVAVLADLIVQKGPFDYPEGAFAAHGGDHAAGGARADPGGVRALQGATRRTRAVDPRSDARRVVGGGAATVEYSATDSKGSALSPEGRR
jgi:hypothetical protein